MMKAERQEQTRTITLVINWWYLGERMTHSKQISFGEAKRLLYKGIRDCASAKLISSKREKSIWVNH